jgi:outer membrane protein
MGLGSGVAKALAGVALTLAIEPASADTLRWALTQAYINNPQINAARAQVRSTDESVPQALSGYRPRISLSASGGEAFVDTLSSRAATSPGASRTIGHNAIQSYGATYSQTLLNGFGTANRTRQAEQQVSAARETLRNVEQGILLLAATSYMNLIRDAAILSLQRSNVEVLQEQLRQTRDRYDVGEVTRTDVAQAESRLAQARAQLLTAESNYATSRASYRQVVGVEPGRLDPASPVDRLSPSNLQQAVVLARAQHPAVTTQMFNVDAAMFQVKVAESALYPTLTAVASVTKSYG